MHLTKISVVYEVAVVVADDVRMHNLKIKIILVRSLPIRSLVDSALRKTKKKKSKYTCIITQCILKVAPPHLSYLCTARVPRLASHVVYLRQLLSYVQVCLIAQGGSGGKPLFFLATVCFLPLRSERP